MVRGGWGIYLSVLFSSSALALAKISFTSRSLIIVWLCFRLFLSETLSPLPSHLCQKNPELSRLIPFSYHVLFQLQAPKATIETKNKIVRHIFYLLIIQSFNLVFAL